MTKIGFISLGCSKNLVDTELMLHKLYTDQITDHLLKKHGES